MFRALAFMADPDLAASVLPAPHAGFDIPAFLAEAGTVYMIAEAVAEEAPVAPLFAAMASEIHWIAAQTGQASQSGRLDPPLLMGLEQDGLRGEVPPCGVGLFRAAFLRTQRAPFGALGSLVTYAVLVTGFAWM